MAGRNTFKGSATTAAITSTASEVLSATGNRRFLLVQNIGSNDVYLKFGGNPTAASDGILLTPNGKGSLVMDVMVESQSLHAVCNATETSTLMVIEGT
jgi:hypothetical protein